MRRQPRGWQLRGPGHSTGREATDTRHATLSTLKEQPVSGAAQYNIYIQFVYTAAQASTVDFQTL
ncbi:hypothetical protein E2C01_018698 [Portunus trituberculatus]|uniref:Uncharacterized protein n=1 Tax=Portunus trituberculatus TaxID=210409 RepID=A0A5B7DVQ7_PORTR|nr:hypothetical protein [Portunus trituberculatus]